MPTIAYLGCSHSDLPMIRYIIAGGNRCIVIGNAPSVHVQELPVTIERVDYSRDDAVVEAVNRRGAEIILAGCNDFAALTAARVSESLAMPGHDSTVASLEIHHKDRFRALLKRLNLPYPRSKKVSRNQDVAGLASQTGFPALVKPVDLTGGKGIGLVRSVRELGPALEQAFSLTREDYVVIEDYIAGTHHSIFCFLHGHRCRFHFHADEYFAANPFLVAGAASSKIQDRASLRSILSQIEKISASLELRNGLLHAQYISSDNGHFYLLELCRRPPGDLYVDLVTHATGTNCAKLIVDAVISPDASAAMSSPTTIQPWLRHCAMPSMNGRFVSNKIDESIQQSIRMRFDLIKPGEIFTNYLNQKSCIAFLQAANYDELKRWVGAANRLLYPIVEQA